MVVSFIDIWRNYLVLSLHLIFLQFVVMELLHLN